MLNLFYISDRRLRLKTRAPQTSNIALPPLNMKGEMNAISESTDHLCS